jgi:hypothetical protein
MLNKGLVVGLMVLTSLTMSSLSAMGVLQSTETVSASGIVVRPATPTPAPAPAPQPTPPEPTVQIDVYSNSGCTTKLTSVVWGQIVAGGSVSKTIYIKNNGDVGVTLSLTTENWSPSNAANYMSLSWNYDGSTISPGQEKQVTLTLNVSADCPALSSFGFNIVIIGS